MIGDSIGIRAPFDVAFVSFLLASTYAWVALPYISPDSMVDAKEPGQQGEGFLAPLKILVPQRLRLENGKIKKHYGVIFLCGGIFLGVVSQMAGTMPLKLTNILARHGLRPFAHPDVRHGRVRIQPK